MQTLYLLITKNADFSYTSLLRSIMGEDGEIYFESEIGDNECYSIDGLEKEKLVEILDEEEIDRNCYTINTEKPVEQPKVKIPATPKTSFANNTNLNVDTSDIDEDEEDGEEHKFRVIKYTNKQAKACIMTMWDDDFLKDHKVCFIYDANEEFLPDTTPEWLYDILNGSPSMGWSEFMESIFEVDNETYEYLINHPDCIESRDATNAEAYGNGDEYDEDDENSDLSNIDFKGWNLHMPIKQGGRKAPKGGKEHLEFLKYDRNCNFYNFLLSDETDDFDGHGKHVDFTTMNKWALKDIDDKIEWGAENAEIIQFGTTKSGIDYAAGWVCMDYGLPMVIFLYWDGKHIRAFVPYRGNCIDTINKCMINEDYNNSAYFKKYFNVDMNNDSDFIYNFGEMLDYNQYNFKDCLEEFEARLEVI